MGSQMQIIPPDLPEALADSNSKLEQPQNLEAKSTLTSSVCISRIAKKFTLFPNYKSLIQLAFALDPIPLMLMERKFMTYRLEFLLT